MGGGGIFNNMLLFENNRLLFPIVFWKFCGGQGLDEGSRVVRGENPVISSQKCILQRRGI